MKIVYILITALLITATSIAQQQGINYKALIKDANGNILSSTPVTVKFIVFDANTSNFYQETHDVDTDANGLIILNIGEGTTTDTFADIDWASDDHYLNVEVDTGNGLVNLGSTQFMAVPYAKHANTATHANTSSDSYWDKNPNGISNIMDDIGIGSDTLSAKLAIFHNSSVTKPHILLKEDGNDYARLSFTTTSSLNTKFSIEGYMGSSEDGRNDQLTFRNDRTGNLMTLKGDGRLGLGVGTSPKTDFHVGNEKRVLFGTDTLGSGDKLMFLPDLHAFRVGTLATGASSIYWNNNATDPSSGDIPFIGTYSFASGYNTRAQGLGATAMGRDTEGQGNYSMATGFFSNADGEYSTAMGHNTDAFGTGSTALGYNTDAEADYSFAVGHTAEAQTDYSVAIGNRVRAQSYASTAIGSYNLGGGNTTTWSDEDPILEVGIGRTESTRANGLTILKDGKHGILTNQPKANLHVKDDGTAGSGTIVAILESSVSDRPILQFSETSNGDFASGMSIEYDGTGSGSDNKMNINNSNGLPIITFDNGGQVGIGVSSPTFALQLPNNSNAGTARAFNWSTYSDQRIKSNITSFQYGLETILSLRPVTYNQHKSSFINSELVLDNEYSNTIGLLAQEVHKVIPEAVIKPKDENKQLWGMDYDKLIPVLIKALQEQQAQIETLKTKNQTQDTALAAILKRLSKLENATTTSKKEDPYVTLKY